MQSNKLNFIGAAVGAVTSIATTVSTIVDQTKRRQFEQAIAGLSLRQQEELEDKLRTANTQTDRMAILSNAILQYAIANENNASNADSKMLIIAGVLGAVLIAAAVLLSIKKT